MANYTKEIAHMLDRFYTKLLSQDKSGFYKKELPVRMSLVEMLTLKKIGDLGSVRLNDLITLLEIDRNLATTTIKNLSSMKYIAKQKDESDGRGQLLHLLPGGELLYHRVLELQQKELSFVLNDVTINEEKAILKFISKMVQYNTEKFEIK